MSNSVRDILAKMQQASPTLGWGAIAALSRADLNLMLERRFAASYLDFSFVPPLSGVYPLSAGGETYVIFDGIMLGPPQLSFESSTLSDTAVVVNLTIIAGRYTKIQKNALAPERLLTSFNITREMGFRVEMDVDLTTTVNEVDGRGSIVCDLTLARAVRCNLEIARSSSEYIGEMIRRHIIAQPPFKHVSLLSLLDLNGYGPLNPRHFAIRTQAAPGARDPGSANHGDGALVIFMGVATRNDGGTLPIDGGNFPYLIPDDRANGQLRYSATLVIAKELELFVDEAQIGALRSSVLPPEYAFADDEQHQPHDFVLFGKVRLTNRSLVVEPLIADVQRNGSHQFTARLGDETVNSDMRWVVNSVNTPQSSGSVSAGRFTAAGSMTGRSVLPSVVTASYATQDGNEHVAAAIALTRYEKVTVAPLVCVRGIGAEAVEFAATVVGGGDLNWELLEPKLGQLTDIGNGRARYILPPDLGELRFVEQKIRAYGETGDYEAHASVILLNTPHALEVEPAYAFSEVGGGSVKFTAFVEGDEVDDARWSLLGSGEISAEGLFTPPAQMTGPEFAIVHCEAPLAAGRSLPGFAVVLFSEAEIPRLHWNSIIRFDLKLNRGAICYANGMQQLPVLVEIETDESSLVPISDVELASLGLYDSDNQMLPFIAPGQEGIERGSGIAYAVNERGNRFVRPRPAGISSDTTIPQNNNTRSKTLYVQLATEETVPLYAAFQGENNEVYRSNGSNAGKIELNGVDPQIDSKGYHIERKRHWNDFPPPKPDPVDPNPNHDWDYSPNSIDLHAIAYAPARFATLKIENNLSTVQWESEHPDEMFFSYTGFLFYPENDPTGDGEKTAKMISYDPYFLAMLKALYVSQPPEKLESGGPSAGELVVSVHRSSSTPIWHDSMADGDRNRLFRAKLDFPVTYQLRDVEGNLHRLTVGFEPPANPDSRNKLELTIESPKGKRVSLEGRGDAAISKRSSS
ncbi:hypothetical protein [Mesorhizobium retamae]|uniref:DUF4815 domain-containing protein n=1 Tax=Mesorhizobium retamae TaxID=2912854 RepID=A0ABS9QP62_9HYPH|nr:hypothetical protein [Mesorhizobium sp. IRAMC:0171]MCG7509242.1 hypothetical protein [Mesorhizobium sp. IRAMC:0171]